MKKALTILAVSASIVTVASALMLGYLYIEDLSKFIYKLKEKNCFKKIAERVNQNGQE